MSSARFWEHVREGAPWVLGVVMVGTYQMDQWHNQGRALRSVRDRWDEWRSSAHRTVVQKGMPLLEALDAMEGEALQHTPDEKFLNMEMTEQLQRLLRWMRTGDWLRAEHFLAVFAKDRVSPATDWPVNPHLHCPELVDEIFQACDDGHIKPALFLAALSGLSVDPGNARHLVTARRGQGIRFVVDALVGARESETATVLGLKALCMAVLHEERPGQVEKVLVQQGAVPYLLSVLNDAPANIYEVRFPSQLLSAIVRSDPTALSHHMEGRYRDAEGNPLRLSDVIVRGLQSADGRAKLPHYLRLARDMCTAGGDRALLQLREADLTGVLLGLLQKQNRYTEILPVLGRLLRLMVHQMQQPHQLLLYDNSVLIMCYAVEHGGRFSHSLVRDLHEAMEHALADPRALAVLDQRRRAQLERFRADCEQQLSEGEMRHVPPSWREADLARLESVQVTPALA